MATTNRTAESIMTPSVLGIVPSAPLDVALRMMVEAGVRHLPVVERGRCVGMLHEADVLWRLWSTAGVEPPRVVVVARTPVVTVAAADDMGTIARQMIDAETDVAVVAQDGRITGIVTAVDVLRRLATDPER